jgi:hypothetical protein
MISSESQKDTYKKTHSSKFLCDNLIYSWLLGFDLYDSWEMICCINIWELISTEKNKQTFSWKSSRDVHLVTFST